MANAVKLAALNVSDFEAAERGANLGHEPSVEEVKVEKGWSLLAQVMGGAREGCGWG